MGLKDMRPRVGLRYPGFILFTARLVSLLTGLLFILLITRTISAAEFGVWGNLADLLTYFTLFAGVAPFWAKRFLARGYVEATKTGLTANLLVSAVASTVYLATLPMLMSVLNVDPAYQTLYTVAALQLVETHTAMLLESILHVERPQTIGYGLLLFEFIKLPLAYLLVVILNLRLLGAVYAIIAAHAFQIIFYLKLVRGKLSMKVRWGYVREWFKASFFNLYQVIGQRVAYLSIMILFTFGGEDARAYFGAAQTIAGIVAYSSALAFTLYPRLLAGGGARDAVTSLKTVLMSAIPMTVGAMVLADSYLIILNPIYGEAASVLRILSVASLLLCLSNMFTVMVYGAERLDEEAKIPLRQLLRSGMFKLATLPYLYSILTVPAAYYAVAHVAESPLESALYLSIISLTVNLTSLAVSYRLAKRSLGFEFPWKPLAKYAAASTAMATVLTPLPRPTVIRYTFAMTALGATVYFAVLYLIDGETRELASMAYRVLRGKASILG